MALSTIASSAFLASAQASAHRWNHEVFLSFRGVDTRKGITSAIYDRLQNMRGIKTFMDGHKIEVGDIISPTLLTAIKESRFAIVVLSQHYADSTWCLEELTTIFECMKDKNRILPLFYQVDPSDVRYQKGSFEDAFTKHKFRHDIEKLRRWKDALRNVANLSGWDSSTYRSDTELVEDIAKLVWSKVRQERIANESILREFEAFDATRLAMDKIMEAIQDDEVAAIGVYGIGGVGKTTLVKHVGSQAREIGFFDKVIMAVVSQTLDVNNIQEQLAEMLALKLNEVTKEGRAFALKEAIMRGNNLLIILDDVWRKIELSSIGIPNKEELQQCNSKFLLTTRSKNVCLQMDIQAKISLSILSKEDSLRLFLRKSRIAVDESAEIYKVASKVARKCAGLPIALITVAQALEDKDLEEWKEAAERLHVSQPTDPEDEKLVFSCIKLSFDYLKSADAKSCLLLCCLFPEDYDIPIEDLFRYGMGKGLFQKSSAMQEARVIADSVVKSLKASSLLLDSEEKGCVKMHDVIRDVALSITSSEDGQQMLVKSGWDLTDWPRINADMNYSAISLMLNNINKLPEELVCSKLVQILILKLTEIEKIPETFFQSQNELRVLDLRYNRISVLPQAFNLLTNLRALFISSGYPNFDLSILGKLGKLEILSVIYHNWDFPKEMEQLSNLRMLDISKHRCFWFPPQLISKLMKLEELYMKGEFVWGCKYNRRKEGQDSDLCCEEFIGLPYLNVLEVQILDAGCLPKVVEFIPHWVKFDITVNGDLYTGDFMSQYKSQRTLCVNTTITNLPDWFHLAVTERTELLVYHFNSGICDMLVEYGTGRLHGVKCLIVVRCTMASYFVWREFMNAVTWEVPVFESLEELNLYVLPCIEICVGELPLGSFCNLKKFKVFHCSKLENALLSANFLKRLQNLEELLCIELPEIDYVFGAEWMELEQSISTKLRTICLLSLGKLRDIYNGPTVPHAIFQNLKILIVAHCGALKYVFPSSCVVHSLVQLEELHVFGCQSLEAVIGGREDTVDNDEVIELPGLKKLLLADLDQLQSFYVYGNTGKAQRILFPSMEKILIVNCPRYLDDLSQHLYPKGQYNGDYSGFTDELLRLLYEVSPADTERWEPKRRRKNDAKWFPN